MAVYATPAKAIITRLSNDSDLFNILGGGSAREFVFNRRLERVGNGATPTAFAPTPPHQVRPSLVVPDEGELNDPLGPQMAFNGFPEVWFYAPTTSNGRQIIDNAFKKVFDLLNLWQYSTTLGTGVVLHVIGRLGTNDDPVLLGTLVDRMRLQADGLWRQE
jgi:hypothetical protein